MGEFAFDLRRFKEFSSASLSPVTLGPRLQQQFLVDSCRCGQPHCVGVDQVHEEPLDRLQAPERDLAITNLGGTCLFKLVSKSAVEGL